MYSERRAMFRAAPFRFLISIAFIPVFGLGILLLFLWWLECRFQTLDLINGQIVFRRGILSKEHIELQASMVRSTRVEQSLFQRIFDVGEIFVTSSGSSPEIAALAMPKPKLFREIIASFNGVPAGRI